MRFCVHCGRQLRDGETCPCQQPQVEKTDVFQQAKNVWNDKKTQGFLRKYWPFLAGAAALIVVVIVLCCTLCGGSYKTPVKNVVWILNEQETEPETILKRLLPGFVKSDVKGIFDDLKEVETLEDSLDEIDDALKEAYDGLEGYFGRNLTVTYEITDKDDMSKRELKNAQEAISDLYDDYASDIVEEWLDMDEDEREDAADEAGLTVKEMESLVRRIEKLGAKLEKVKVTKGYELALDVYIEGKKEDMEYEDLTVRVIKVNGDWMVDFTSLSEATALGLIADMF